MKKEKEYIQSKNLCYGGYLRIYDDDTVVIKGQNDIILLDDLKKLIYQHHLKTVDKRIIGE